MAVDVAVALGNLDRLEALIGLLEDEPHGRVPPMLRAELRRAHGLLAAAQGEHDLVEGHLRAAMAGFIELGYPFHLARATAEELEAEPLLARIRKLGTPQRLSA